MKNLLNRISTLAVLTLLCSCAVTPKHLDDLHQDKDEQFMRIVETSRDDIHMPTWLNHHHNAIGNEFRTLKNDGNKASSLSLKTVFSRGDVVKIRIGDSEQASGLYQISQTGNIDLPTISIQAEGLSKPELIDTMKSLLIEKEWLLPDYAPLSINLVRLAPVNIMVSGAVFNSGRVSINNQPISKPEDPIQLIAGGFTQRRDLTAALQSAGGLRPDADLRQIYIRRGNTISKLSLEAILSGEQFFDTPSLVHGDEIFVASTHTEDSSLIRTSQLTPPGMRVLMSNLTAPALTNAQSAVGADSTRLPYGSSLLDAAVSANCVGGTQSANASRSVLLITRNYGGKKQLVIKRTINQLLKASSSSQVNPFLMPNDAIACYDSRFTNFRDVARGLGEVLGPVILGGLL